MRVVVGTRVEGPGKSQMPVEFGAFDIPGDAPNVLESTQVLTWLPGFQLTLPDKLPGLGKLSLKSPLLQQALDLQAEFEFAAAETVDGAAFVNVPREMKLRRIQAGTRLDAAFSSSALVLTPTGWELRCTPEADATIEFCGIRFRLPKEQEVRIGPLGLMRARGTALPGRIRLGDLLTSVEVVGGSVEVNSGAVHVSVSLAFSLASFNEVRGELDLELSWHPDSPRWLVSARTRVQSRKSVTDPSGWIRFSDIGVVLDCSVDGGTGSINVERARLSGTASFDARKIAGGAGEWLRDLFTGVQVAFRDAEVGAAEFRIKLLDALRIRALHVLDIEIPEFKLEGANLELMNLRVRTDLGAGSFSGRMPSLRLNMRDGRLDGKLALDLALSTPGGIKATAQLEYFDEGKDQYLLGSGVFSSPAFPGVGIRFRLGRSEQERGWVPNVLLIAQTDVDIPLFTGVMVRNLGLGFAINLEVPGTSRLSLREAQKAVENGLPDVRDPTEWKPARGRGDVVSLIAAAKVSASKGDRNTPDIYAGDLAIILTSEAQWAIVGKFWVFTSVNKCSEPRFAREPLVSALVLLDGQAQSLRAAAVTNTDSATEAQGTGPLASIIASFPKTRFAFEATSSSLTVAIGPNTLGGELGRLTVEGTSLMALHASKQGDQFTAFAISTLSFSAAYTQAASLSLGPVHLRARARFGFSYDSTLIGRYRDSELLLYAGTRVQAYAGIDLNVRIEFEIRINAIFKKIVIRWSQSWDFNWTVYVDLTLKVAVSSRGKVGFVGQADVSVNVLGIKASVNVPVTVDPALVAQAEAVREETQKLIGA